MGFVLIRHSVVAHRRVNIHRVPEVLCVGEIVGKMGEVRERENLCLRSVSGASRETISASVELNCVKLKPASCTSNFLVRLPKMHRNPPDVDFESSRSPAKSES